MSFDGTYDVLDGGVSSDYELADEHTIEKLDLFKKY